MNKQKDDLLVELQRLLSQKKSKLYYSQKLGITVDEVNELLEEIRAGEFVTNEAEISNYISELEDRVVKENFDKGTLESSVVTNFEPKNPEELAELHKIDLSKYKISTYWTKLKSNGKFTSSVLCTLKKPNEFSPEDFAKFLVNYKSPQLKFSKIPNDGEASFTDRDSVDVEISIADFHLDRLTLQRDSIVQRQDEYKRVLNSLVRTTSSIYNINKYIFVIGNDLFNNDNYQGSTTSLTPQDNSTTWSNAYERAFDLMVQSISILKEYSTTVEVVLVQGNHDRTKSYYLAHALEAYFKSEPNIVFDRGNTTTKFTIAGNTFIGYHHGNCKIDDLPLLFATSKETKMDFACATYQEVHTADKHFYMAKEIKGVRVQQIPSMANPDRWSTDNNYVNNIRAALALVYHPTKGKIAEFEERI